MSRLVTGSRLAILIASAGIAVTGSMAVVPSASALPVSGGLVNSPDYCLAVYGDPSPCPAPDRPDPVDPRCLRTDVTPLHCPWLP
jgi:hypothetical protein